MTRYLALAKVLRLHEMIIQTSGGAAGMRDLGGFESALAQPRATFGGQDLHPEKASTMGCSIIQNHPFVDGNKRVGHAALEVFLVLNGFETEADVDEQEDVFLRVASGEMRREELTDWLRNHVRSR